MEIKEKVFCVDKPLGWTSNDVVQFIKHKYRFRKVGHAGTLDPNASGVLVIGINEGTKELGKLILEDKTYMAQIQLGIETDSYDITGNIAKKELVRQLSLEEITNAVNCFAQSCYYQFPPKYSAIKIKGKKLYEYARENKDVKIEPRLVKINSIDKLEYDRSKKLISIEMNVSKGFYIRSFAHDLAKKLDTCGCLLSLCRTKSGNFDLSDCIKIDFKHKSKENL